MSDQDKESFLDMYVGEGKKYTDVETLAKSYYHLEQHTDTIKSEKEDLVAKLDTQTKQEDHLNTIVDLLQPKEEVMEVPTPEPEQKKEVEETIDLNLKLKQEEFARKAIEAYGTSEAYSEALNEFIGKDAKRQELARHIMDTDPTTLLQLLPKKEESKSFNPTSHTGMTTGHIPSLPTTGKEATKLMKENQRMYRSSDFQTKLRQSIDIATKSGINFWET